MDEAEMRTRVAGARVARLATARGDGRPHVVPVCFAIAGDEIVTAVDAKPKSTTALARLDNVRANPTCALLVDHYTEDWSDLWWVRVDGVARVVTIDEAHTRALAAKYEQYVRQPPTGDAIVITPTRFVGWAGTQV
jgi:PPOX class probable F420-dependent enzyme